MRGIRIVTATTVTLLGATGFVGGRVLRNLDQQGIRVEAVSRQPRPPGLSPNIGWTQADLNEPGAVARIPWSETVISTVFVAMTAQVVEQWSRGASRRLVAFSSTSALTKSNSSESSDREISVLLSEGEARLRELHPKVTILRPTMIYGGPGDRNVERVAQQLLKFPFFPLVGSGMGLRQPVHADDLATAAVLATKSSLASGKAYNLAGSEVLPFRQMIQRIGAANNSAVRFVSIPLPAARTALLLLSSLPRFRGIPLGSLERMNRDLVFDISQARHDFRYAPRAFEPSTY